MDIDLFRTKCMSLLKKQKKLLSNFLESSFSNLSFETFRRQKRKKLPHEQISPTKLKSKKLKGEGSIEEIEENYLDDDFIGNFFYLTEA